MSDIEGLLRSVLAERADDVAVDPVLAQRIRNITGPGRRPRPARWAGLALGTAAAVTAVVVAVQVLTDGSGATAPASPPSGVTPATPAVSSPSRPRSTGPVSPFPPGRIPLTPGSATLGPDRPGGCATFATAQPSTPEPPPPMTIGGTLTTPPAATPSASGDGRPGDPFSWIRSSPSPEVMAVMSDLEHILDGTRFAGYSVDGGGRSLTVRVVSGPSAAAAAALAQGCARAGASIHIGYVARGRDVLTGLAATLDRSLPAGVAPLVSTDSSRGMPSAGIDIERNRLVLYASGTLTAAMKRDLWIRYGDAVEVWQADRRALAEPSPAWAQG